MSNSQEISIERFPKENVVGVKCVMNINKIEDYDKKYIIIWEVAFGL